MDTLAPTHMTMQMPYFPIEPFEQGLLLVYSLAFIVQMIYFWVFYSRLAFYKKRDDKTTDEPVSVVICAKNEYYKLKMNLPLILEQDHPSFEVVVVNDNSQDDSLELLEDMAREHSNLKIVNLSQDLNFFQGKKFPLSLGIKSASNDILLLTDADCRPSSKDWIKNMSGKFRGEKEIVLGYGGYERKRNLINYIIRYETLWVAIQYLSFSLAGRTYMGVGRNMLYSKSLFYRNKGFSSHYTVASGDDDLFINSVANRKNVAIEIAHGSHTISAPKTSFSSWIIQKRRHLTTWKYYRGRFKRLLGLWSVSQIIFLALFVILLILGYNMVYIAGLFILRFFSHLMITKKSMNKLNEKELLLISPLAELFLVILYPVLSLVNMFSKADKWK
ncbi:MAG: glycosyltransferase [Bacteroidetes bacterium]|nr:glycosyltransferase [Bacteroidota bacterium]